jgi:H+/Cl- antiporter ClcA
VTTNAPEPRASAVPSWLIATGLALAVGLACGAASAAFLLLLEHATIVRGHHEALVYALPVAGIALGFVYERWGAPIKGGNNLVIDTIHDASPQIPLRMAPMVLVGTVLTHLFGGSAGREGTAVQMGASLADDIAHRFGADSDQRLRRLVIVAGIAGGFGSVFGTPIAGAVFGLEVLVIGRVELRVLFPAVVASFTGDWVTRHLGVVHTPYPHVAYVPLEPLVIAELALIGAAMALASISFIELTHHLKALLEKRLPRLPARMFVGGCAVVAMWSILGSSDYLGLGVPMILRAFSDPRLPSYAFAAKIVFTAVTLASGFLGGEVTPLFFVGATLGSVMARLLGLPIELGAVVGLAAVFGAAANTPIALSIMAAELCGPSVLPHVLFVTLIAFLLSGHRGIYPSQRVHRTKRGRRLERPVALRDYKD